MIIWKNIYPFPQNDSAQTAVQKDVPCNPDQTEAPSEKVIKEENESDSGLEDEKLSDEVFLHGTAITQQPLGQEDSVEIFNSSEETKFDEFSASKTGNKRSTADGRTLPKSRSDKKYSYGGLNVCAICDKDWPTQGLVTNSIFSVSFL